ncbi:MAG: hypothetical protein GY829_05170 [Gammaproteobacteria bacterium]|nr:hypothetical protein [Gammaproteobacteria bacterium]
MNSLNLKRKVVLASAILIAFPAQIFALSIATKPLYIGSSGVAPAVMIMLDNSGSMIKALTGNVEQVQQGYDVNKIYTGIFESDQMYQYNELIPVNPDAYYTTVDTAREGAFIEADCTPSISDTICWHGNYLNYQTGRKIDGARNALVGGKLESNEAYDYGSGLSYKIVGANSFADDKIVQTNSPLNTTYTPIPNYTTYAKSPSRFDHGWPDWPQWTASGEPPLPILSGHIKNNYKPYGMLMYQNGNPPEVSNKDPYIIYNIAIAVAEKPTGLLHAIKDDVRLGVSFYSYDKTDENIYKENVNNGGTLNFQIPKNPFVKYPANSLLTEDERGYRQLSGYIGTDIEELSDAIQHMPTIWGTTPLGENLYEVLQYFQQNDPYYTNEDTLPNFEKADNSNKNRDPFYYPDVDAKLECAEPKVIIFTDGEPAADESFPDDFPSTSVTLTDHNALSEVAKWGFCKEETTCPDANGFGTRDLRSDIEGNQALRVYTVYFGEEDTQPQILKDAADNAGGKSYEATDDKALEAAILDIIYDIPVTKSSAAAASFDSAWGSGGTYLYQSMFNAENWTGDLLAYEIQSDGTLGSLPTWTAADQLDDVSFNNRKIFTTNYDDDGDQVGNLFQANFISPSQKNQITTTNDQTEAEFIMKYISGDTTNESDASTYDYRQRDHVLGDIVHSSAIYVGDPSLYKINDSSQQRIPVIYVGANDGMLHAFKATDGSELFAYVPTELFPKLKELTSPTYSHQYYVDATPNTGDVDFGSAGSADWHTILVGGLGAGGQGVYALDITDPAHFVKENVLWEFNDDHDEDLGYTFGENNIVKMANGSWTVIFGNGYGSTEADGKPSTTGNAVLYIVNIQTGEVLKKIDTGVGSTTNPNGLSGPAPVDIDGDNIVDYIYAGDLYGNMWKFDVSDTDESNWGVAFSGKPLFTACAGSNCTSDPAQQPITSRPQIGRHPTGKGYMVFFGTGKSFETDDATSSGQNTQTFYGIWDRETDHQEFDRTHLLEQKIIKETEVTVNGVKDYAYRTLSDNAISWHSSTSSLPSGDSTHLGWYMDLINTYGSNTDNYGERQITNSVLSEYKITFTTMSPVVDGCAISGTGWTMDLSPIDGGPLEKTPYDVDGNGSFNATDFLEDLATSGYKKLTGGIPAGSSRNIDSNGKEFDYTTGSNGDIGIKSINLEATPNQRASWRQLF